MYIIDFDDTIFNTKKFKEIRKAALGSFGITEEQYDKSYELARVSQSGIITYTNQRHAEVLAEMGLDRDEVFTALAETTTKEVLASLLFDDAHQFLQALSDKTERLVLLSLGEEQFQRQKTVGCGIVDYFDQIMFVQHSKKEVIGDLLKYDDVEADWFVNDKVQETMDIVKAYPTINAVIKSENTDLDTAGIPVKQTLTQVLEYIEKN